MWARLPMPSGSSKCNVDEWGRGEVVSFSGRGDKGWQGTCAGAWVWGGVSSKQPRYPPLAGTSLWCNSAFVPIRLMKGPASAPSGSGSQHRRDFMWGGSGQLPTEWTMMLN